MIISDYYQLNNNNNSNNSTEDFINHIINIVPLDVIQWILLYNNTSNNNNNINKLLLSNNKYGLIRLVNKSLDNNVIEPISSNSTISSEATWIYYLFTLSILNNSNNSNNNNTSSSSSNELVQFIDSLIKYNNNNTSTIYAISLSFILYELNHYQYTNSNINNNSNNNNIKKSYRPILLQCILNFNQLNNNNYNSSSSSTFITSYLCNNDNITIWLPQLLQAYKYQRVFLVYLFNQIVNINNNNDNIVELLLYHLFNTCNLHDYHVFEHELWYNYLKLELIGITSSNSSNSNSSNSTMLSSTVKQLVKQKIKEAYTCLCSLLDRSCTINDLKMAYGNKKHVLKIRNLLGDIGFNDDNYLNVLMTEYQQFYNNIHTLGTWLQYFCVPQYPQLNALHGTVQDVITHLNKFQLCKMQLFNMQFVSDDLQWAAPYMKYPLFKQIWINVCRQVGPLQEESIYQVHTNVFPKFKQQFIMACSAIKQ